MKVDDDIRKGAHGRRARRGGRALRRVPRERGLRIAMLAPPWIPVPPPAYGGIESVVSLLTDELTERGHAVTMFAAPGTTSKGTVRTLLEDAQPDMIGHALYEADHVARAFGMIDKAAAGGEPFDVVHDHCGFTALAMADRLRTPLVHTLHGAFTADTTRFYSAHAAKALLVAISRYQLDSAPREVHATVVPNPIVVDDWPLRREKDDYLLWIGRMTEEKGPHRAIEAARRAEMPLIMAGPVQPGHERFFADAVKPHIDGTAVRYVGEVGGTVKTDLFAGAAALLMPIRWAEPFGLVMIEAMACGTPVISYAEGAANEIVRVGENGYLVADESEMARAAHAVGEIDPERCRASVETRYDVHSVADSYEAVYRRAIATSDREVQIADVLGSEAAPRTIVKTLTA